MREIVIKLTGKLEECFECLNDDLAAKAILNILKHRAYIELRAGGREFREGEEVTIQPLPETEFKKEEKAYESQRIEELHAMIQGLTDIIQTGVPVTPSIKSIESPPTKSLDKIGSDSLAAALSEMKVSNAKTEVEKIVVDEDEDVDYSEFEFLGL